jgi:hypothetical protein
MNLMVAMNKNQLNNLGIIVHAYKMRQPILNRPYFHCQLQNKIAMKTTISFLILLFLLAQCSGQILFTESFGDSMQSPNSTAYMARQTSDGGYILAGHTQIASAGLWDLLLIKLAADGDTLWTNIIGSTDSEHAYDIIQTTDSGFLVVGISSLVTGRNLLAVRTDANGNPVWTKTFGGLTNEMAWSVVETPNGGFLLAGNRDTSTSSQVKDIFLLSINSVGDTIWTRTFGTPEDNQIFSMRSTSDQGFILSGLTTDPSNAVWHGLLMKLDSNGMMDWARLIGQANAMGIFDARQTSDGGYILCGATSTFNSHNLFITKTDVSGIPLWTKLYDGLGSPPDNGVPKRYCLELTADGGYAIGTIADFNLPLILITDSIGNVQHLNRLNPSTTAAVQSINSCADGGYVLSGNFGNLAVVIKTNSSGNSCWNAMHGVNVTADSFFTAPFSMPVTNHTYTVSTPVYSVTHGIPMVVNCGPASVFERQHPQSFSVFPNPNNGKFTIRFDRASVNGKVILVDATGRKLSKKKFRIQ